MAKIAIEVDTEKREVVATVDGEVLENFYCCSVYMYGEGRFDCTISQNEKMADGLVKTTQLTAYGSEKAAGAVQKGDDVFLVKTDIPLRKFMESQIGKFRY